MTIDPGMVTIDPAKVPSVIVDSRSAVHHSARGHNVVPHILPDNATQNSKAVHLADWIYTVNCIL